MFDVPSVPRKDGYFKKDSNPQRAGMGPVAKPLAAAKAPGAVISVRLFAEDVERLAAVNDRPEFVRRAVNRALDELGNGRRYSEQDAAGICEMCRTGFLKIAEAQMLSPAEAWQKLEPLCDNMTAAQVEKFRSVLSGWSDWTAAEINELTPPNDELGYPAQALDRLGEGLMLSTLRELQPGKRY